jgi:hypothetical protein
MLFKKCVVALGAIGGMSLVSMAGCSSSTTTDAGTDGSVMDDTGTTMKDSGKDTGKDTGIEDSGPMCPTPTDVSAFMPPAYKGPVVPSNACADSDVMTYYTDCVDMYDQTKCNAFTGAHMGCATCLETIDPSKVTALGASFDRGPYIFLNTAGCVDINGDKACAQALQALDACEDAGCLDICWNQSAMMQADADALDKCYTAIDGKGCKKYVDDINAKCGADSGAFATCKVSSFATSYPIYAKIFCQAGG